MQDTITLNEAHRQTIQEVISNSDEYNTPEEVVQAGLTLLKRRQEKKEALRKAIQEGRDSGYIEDFDWDAHRAELMRDYEKKHAKV